jgi:DNA-binding NarL/FixJ family response regulator
MRIMIVSDTGEVRARIGGLARLLLLVENGEQALAAARLVSPDAILVASRHGAALAYAPMLRASCPDAGLVIVPDVFDRDEGRECIAAGANLYVERWPRNLAALVSAASSAASAVPVRRAV